MPRTKTTGTKQKRQAVPPRRVKITATGSGPLIDPDTGRAYVPMSRSELIKVMEGRQWAGDAAETMFSPCAKCGGPCGKAATYSAPWRVHRACSRIGTHPGRIRAAVGELLATEITFADAGLIAAVIAVPSYSDLPNVQPHTRPGQVWGHVSKRKLRKAVQSLPTLRAEAGLTPRPCVSGPCAWCSIQRATGWQTFGHKWTDGSPAPLCGACSEQWIRRGGLSGRLSTTFYDEQRPAAWNELIGRDLPMGHGPDPAFRIYAEIAPLGRTGYDERFGYIAAAQRPGTVEFTERVQSEQAEAAALAEQRRAEQAEAERQQRERWGFEVTK